MRKVVKIGEATDMSKDERLRRYRETVDELQEMVYSFLHGMAKKDKGTLHLLAEWLIGAWLKADHNFDLEALLQGVCLSCSFLFFSSTFINTMKL
jgi:hypothetical protein